jgi:hypothetical protein
LLGILAAGVFINNIGGAVELKTAPESPINQGEDQDREDQAEGQVSFIIKEITDFL